MSKLIKNIDKKIKKQLYRIKFLKAELEEVEELLEEYIEAFRKEISEMKTSQSVVGDIKYSYSTIDTYKEVESNLEFTDSLKKLYKDIMFNTHPDKTQGFEDKIVKKYNEMFLKASNSIEKGNAYDILESAEFLNLDITNLGFEELMLLHAEADRLENKINFHKNTYEWKWYKSGKNQNYIERYIKIMEWQ